MGGKKKITETSISACHRCPHGIADEFGDIKPEHLGKSYSEIKCSTCKLSHSNSVIRDNDRYNDWRTPISFESLTPDGYICDAEKTLWGEDREDWTKHPGAADFFRLWLRMDATDQMIVSGWILGESLTQISAKTGISTQAVHKRLKKLQRNEPTLKKAGDVSRCKHRVI